MVKQTALSESTWTGSFIHLTVHLLLLLYPRLETGNRKYEENRTLDENVKLI